MESSFSAFGGVPEEVLFDNPRALVAEHDAENRTVVFCLSIDMEPGPPIGVQKGPLCGVGLGARG